MKEVDPHMIQVLLYIISGFSALTFLLITTVAFFLKRLINKVDILQSSVYDLNGKVSNVTSEVGFIETEIKDIKGRLMRNETETVNMRERIKALEVYTMIDRNE
jgi:cell division protein FtsB